MVKAWCEKLTFQVKWGNKTRWWNFNQPNRRGSHTQVVLNIFFNPTWGNGEIWPTFSVGLTPPPSFFSYIFTWPKHRGLMIQFVLRFSMFLLNSRWQTKHHHLCEFFQEKHLCEFYGTCFFSAKFEANCISPEFIFELTDHNNFCSRFLPPRITVPRTTWPK